MDILLVVLAFVFLVAGLLGAIIPVIPGPPLSFAGLLVLQWSGHAGFTVAFLLLWAFIAAAVTILDYVLPSFMTKRFGGSRAAAIGSFLGLLAGMFFFPPFGLILGPFLGAFAGELINSNSNGAKAFKVALGSFIAFLAGSGAKLVVSGIMLFYAARALF
ncbi:MAG: DUF456 domain-containing protein [Treponema sp.]|nr:DUF456 domain-containing protein [Treponema sp.]